MLCKICGINKSAHCENYRLQNIHGCLFSYLMSGKIDVENLDIQFPVSMNEEVIVNA